MSSEVEAEILQSILQYYKSKCSQLEYEFLTFKLTTEREIKELRNSVNTTNEQNNS